MPLWAHVFLRQSVIPRQCFQRHRTAQYIRRLGTIELVPDGENSTGIDRPAFQQRVIVKASS